MTTALATGSFTGVGQTPAFYVMGRFNVALWGNFVGAVVLERSLDGEVTWLNCSLADMTDNEFTAPVSTTCNEPETGASYRFNCKSYTSGPINWRMSQ